MTFEEELRDAIAQLDKLRSRLVSLQKPQASLSAVGTPIPENPTPDEGELVPALRSSRRRVPLPVVASLSSDTTKEWDLALWFIEEQRKRYPRMVKTVSMSQLEAGQHTLIQLQRIDGFSWEEVEAVVRYTPDDSFWARNILSPSSFRQKCRNGATKFANVYEKWKAEYGGTRPVVTEKIVHASPIFHAYKAVTGLEPMEMAPLGRDLIMLWESFPGETTRKWIVPPDGSDRTPKRSVKHAAGSLANVEKLYADFIRERYANFKELPFSSLRAGQTTYQRFLLHLSKLWGVDLKTGELSTR